VLDMSTKHTRLEGLERYLESIISEVDLFSEFPVMSGHNGDVAYHFNRVLPEEVTTCLFHSPVPSLCGNPREVPSSTQAVGEI